MERESPGVLLGWKGEQLSGIGITRLVSGHETTHAADYLIAPGAAAKRQYAAHRYRFAPAWGAITTPALLVRAEQHAERENRFRTFEVGPSFTAQGFGNVPKDAQAKSHAFSFCHGAGMGWSGLATGRATFMTEIITLRDHQLGTELRRHVMHRNIPDRKHHQDMGFFEGWGTVAEQLANLVEEAGNEGANAEDRFSDDDDAEWTPRSALRMGSRCLRRSISMDRPALRYLIHGARRTDDL